MQREIVTTPEGRRMGKWMEIVETLQDLAPGVRQRVSGGKATAMGGSKTVGSSTGIGGNEGHTPRDIRDILQMGGLEGVPCDEGLLADEIATPVVGELDEAWESQQLVDEDNMAVKIITALKLHARGGSPTAGCGG